MAKIEEKVETLVQNSIEALGYELYDVEYVKEGKDYFLRIYIDSPKGISLEDCEKVSNEINDNLDTEDYIKEQYFLEVSSCGLERTLRKDKHLEKYIGSNIEIKLYKPLEKKKQYEGILKSFNKESLTIQEENLMTINRADIARNKNSI